jgi:hypothetical protein
MLLDNVILQDRYARDICSLYNRWSTEPENRKRAAIESSLNQIATLANLPMPMVVWKSADSSFFRISPWEIHASLRAVTINPADDFKTWLHKVSSPYHELRHADQHRVIVEAYLTKSVPLPALLTKNIVGTDGHQPSTMQNEGFPYSPHIIARLRSQKNEFQTSWISQAREWSESFFGRESKARHQTMNTLESHGKGKHYGQYRALPEEADAFRVQTQVKRRIKDFIKDFDIYNDIKFLFD